MAAASLSSYTVNGISFPKIVIQSDTAGSADPFMKSASATSSASGVEVDVPLCFLLWATSGKNDRGPVKQRNPPDVDLQSFLSPAKSASAKAVRVRSFNSSPINPTSLSLNELLM